MHWDEMHRVGSCNVFVALCQSSDLVAVFSFPSRAGGALAEFFVLCRQARVGVDCLEGHVCDAVCFVVSKQQGQGGVVEEHAWVLVY